VSTVHGPSALSKNTHLQLSIITKPIPRLKNDEVLIRVEAAPINPSDIRMLIPQIDIKTIKTTKDANGTPELTANILERGLPLLQGRLNKPISAGNEGCGTVVEAGSDTEAQGLLGKRVALLGGMMYAQYRAARAVDCLELLPGTTAAQGASCFVNPVTTLAMIGTAAAEGHKALVHTAAASQLGQMLVRLCHSENIPLVNIVRRPEQVTILKDIGAKYVVDSSQPNFREELVEAIDATGATCAFDATGGGTMATTILWAMEAAALRKMKNFSAYGTDVMKQVYIYGVLDKSPITIHQNFGFQWRIGGWLSGTYVQKIGNEKATELKKRVAREIGTTFRTHYSDEISLEEVLDAEILKKYATVGTAGKFLINPNKEKAKL